MHIYHLKTCDTCRKAIKALSGRNPSLVDVRADGVAREILKGWLENLGADLLVNRKSTSWRNLSEAERAGDPLALLEANPTLMKRPVIVEGENVHLGWSKSVQEALGVS